LPRHHFLNEQIAAGGFVVQRQQIPDGRKSSGQIGGFGDGLVQKGWVGLWVEGAHGAGTKELGIADYGVKQGVECDGIGDGDTAVFHHCHLFLPCQ
jgi:hypothetical protein